jgi:hypothetical protein
MTTGPGRAPDESLRGPRTRDAVRSRVRERVEQDPRRLRRTHRRRPAQLAAGTAGVEHRSVDSQVEPARGRTDETQPVEQADRCPRRRPRHGQRPGAGGAGQLPCAEGVSRDVEDADGTPVEHGGHRPAQVVGVHQLQDEPGRQR